MSEPTQLKPCPFCGSEATMDQFESASWGGLLTVIGCSSSECHMSPATDEVPVEMAMAAWNSRPTEDAAIKERDAEIVAWLRDRKEMTDRYIDYVETAQAADCIEAGEV